jgi:Na+/H+ antiporter NhaD/arsenite permease-like protein
LSRKQLIAAAPFLLAAIYLASIVPTIQIAWVTGILLLTIYLFALKVVEVDTAAASIIAVMIIGAGLDKTGLMSEVAAFILKVAGTTETRIIPVISATFGVISSFMQNVGAAALFLPVVMSPASPGNAVRPE